MRSASSFLSDYGPLAAAMTLAVVAGCASYSPHPLDKSRSLGADVAELDRGDEALPARLGLDELTMLALRNNPDLISARARHGLAQAQLLAAGIAPNPSLSASYGVLLGGPGTTASFSAGLSQEVRSLLTLSSKRAAAAAAAREIDGQILWQEWQTIAKVRLLVVDLIVGQKLHALLENNAAQLEDLLARNQVALQRGDTTLTALVPDLGAAAAARTQLNDLERQLGTKRRDLNVLVGLEPNAALPLATDVEVPDPDPQSVEAALPGLADRRPDLIALQLGYESQEKRLRAAVLAQFPMLALGVSGGHDNSDVRFVGPTITLELPVFDRNQGNIAIESATRQQLHDEFTARLATAKAEVRGLTAEMSLLRSQLARKRPRMAELEETVLHVQSAYASGDLDERTYVDALSGRTAAEQEVLLIQLSLLEQQVAVDTLIGAGMPAVSMTAQVTK